MSRRKSNIVAELRKAILEAEHAGVTRYKLAQESGVEQAVLSKVIHRTRVVRLDTAEKIVLALGKRLVILDD
jgi:hypothetical protein